MSSFGDLTSHGYGTCSPLPRIKLDVTPDMVATLEEISRDTKRPLNVVFMRTISLYETTLRATAEGGHVGYATSSDALDVELTGLAGPEAR